MKKVYNILFIVCLVTLVFNMTCVSNKEFKGRYEVNAPQMTEEELKEYYIKNDIRPASVPKDIATLLTKETVSNHLSDRFPEYPQWMKSTGVSVSNTYGKDPIITNEDDNITQIAKHNAGISYEYIGCGPLAMVTQFDFLARAAGYHSIMEDADSKEEQLNLQTQIFKETSTIPTFNGTFTFPSDLILSCKRLLEDKYLGYWTTKETIDNDGNVNTSTYYERDSQIYVYGDTMPSFAKLSTKINNLMDSINRGMPVIWWTAGGAGEFSNHYMNIYAYEYWVAVDDNGHMKTHLMFKLRCNWDEEEDIYMDSDVLDAINCGFIYFEETRDKSLVKPKDFDFPCQYENIENFRYTYASEGKNYDILTKWLRTGYVNHYNSTNTMVDKQLLVLSAKRENAGVAYLELKLPVLVQEIYFRARWWSNSEGINRSSGSAVVQYKNGQDEWVTAFDFLEDIPYPGLSYLDEYPTDISIKFPISSNSFRIYIQTDDATGNRNKGRMVIGDMNIFYDHHSTHSYNHKYEQHNSSYHKSYCTCGDFIYEPHSSSDIGTLSTINYHTCPLCGYVFGASALL